VDDIIRTAWENDDILSRVKKTYVRGNLKVAFELSADGAYVHNEGTTAPTEESLALGIVTMIPKNIKKWIHVSDEAIAMGGENLVRYIYDELTYQIIKKLSALVVDDVKDAKTTADADECSVAKITSMPSVTTFAEAFANLSDEARNPVIVMNKLTYANFISAQAAGNFLFDPFRNFPVAFSSELPAYDTASTGDVYAFIGDMSGVQLWAQNGGMDTWTELMCEPDGIVKEILAKLKKLPLTATYTSPQGKTFYMSHSGSYSPIKYAYRGKWVKVDPDADCLWDRSHLDIQTWSDNYPDDYVIHGHSPVQNFFKTEMPTIYCEGHKIDLDVASFVTKKVYLYDLDEMTIAAEFKSE
jgi:hypothetical protein